MKEFEKNIRAKAKYNEAGFTKMDYMHGLMNTEHDRKINMLTIVYSF